MKVDNTYAQALVIPDDHGSSTEGLLQRGFTKREAIALNILTSTAPSFFEDRHMPSELFTKMAAHVSWSVAMADELLKQLQTK